MDFTEAIKTRHSVRKYLEKPIEQEKRAELEAYAAELNAESGLSMQLVFDEPNCFATGLASYGAFKNANNYIAVVGPKGADAERRAGYYGEHLVLKAQQLGLNTCWVALTHGKVQADVADGQQLIIVIALGYGETQGVDHKIKSVERVSNYDASMPDWFKQGVEAALLAPTAINQQKFFFTYENGRVSVKVKGIGTKTRIDLGIVESHFELASGHKVA